MKLPSEKDSVITEQFKEALFGIRSIDMGLIIEILRSKMYSDPIATICQEIASNARDANREVGKKHKPIKISIVDSLFRPTEIDLIIEDEGPGISPERMTEIFVYYGASTKRDTNTQTGGYGLGCKTPFAYADTFSVVTKCEGKKYSYQAVIENNRSGKVFLTHTEPTTECNGTAIIIPIKDRDRHRFSEECYRATFFWKDKPIYMGLDEHADENCFFPKIIREDDRAILVGNSALYSRDGYYALVDSIPYYLDSNLLVFTHPSRCSVFFKFKTGVLSIAASRESLHYDDKTKKALKEVYDAFVKDELAMLVQKVAGAATMLQAKIYRAQVLEGPCQGLLSNHAVTWSGKKVSSEFDSMKLYRVEKNYGGYTKHFSCDIPHDLLTIPCVEMDLQKFMTPRNDTLLKDKKFFYVVGPYSTEKNQEYEEFKKLIGKIPLYSEVPYIRQKKGTTKLEVNEIRGHTLSRGWRWGCKNCIPIPKNFHVSELAKIKFMYIALPKISDLKREDAIWYYLTQEASGYRAFIVRPKFIPFIKDLCTPYDAVLKTVEHDFSELSHIMRALDFSDIIVFSSLTFKDEIKKDLNYIAGLKKKARSDHKIWGLADEFPSQGMVLDKYPMNDAFKKAQQTYKDIMVKYPLLKHVENHTKLAEQKEFDRYIALIDKENEQLAIDANQPELVACA